MKLAPSGVDEQAGILLMNRQQEMAAVSLSLHSKQPKRGMIAYEKGFIEVYEYPRADEAVITYTEDGHRETIRAGKTEGALRYEVRDMEKTVSGKSDEMHMDYTKDVMDLMTDIRKSWNMKYPEEQRQEECCEIGI